LIQHNGNINESYSINKGPHPPEIAVKAYEYKRKRNKEKFPDPKSISIEFDNTPYDGINLTSAMIQDDHGKK
jgi:hypothetical protein